LTQAVGRERERVRVCILKTDAYASFVDSSFKFRKGKKKKKRRSFFASSHLLLKILFQAWSRLATMTLESASPSLDLECQYESGEGNV
jgi:hypothetical protein